MEYSEVLEYLYQQLPMFQRTGPSAYKNNLDNTILLDNYYGNPHKKFRTIHVAGTNGKGSVSHMLAAILQTAGYKTGLYTSPHLKDFRERIRLNGKMIPEAFVTKWVGNFLLNNELWKIEPSFFELTVILAFDYFASEEVDVVVVEVGLGGRLDSTNIIYPELSIITNIGLDHTSLLGETIDKIALEKAGIIKSGVPIIIGTTQPETTQVYTQEAQKKQAEIFFADQEFSIPYSLKDLEGKQVMNVIRMGVHVYPDLKLDLLGLYQRKNLPAVLKSMDLLNKRGWEIKEKDLYKGLANTALLTGLQGRWQVVSNNPLIICDTGHNVDGISEVLAQIEQTPYKKLHIVFGVVNDKDPDNILRLMPSNARYYFSKANIPRALNEKILSKKAADFGLCGESYSSVSEAFDAAKCCAGKDDMIYVGGSTFVVAEIL